MNIEAKKVQLEILKMEANIIDAEIRVSEKMAEIDKINDNISKYWIFCYTYSFFKISTF